MSFLSVQYVQCIKKYANYFYIFHEDAPQPIIKIFACLPWWLMILEWFVKRKEDQEFHKKYRRPSDIETFIGASSLYVLVPVGMKAWASEPENYPEPIG